MKNNRKFDVIIIGGSYSGLSAAMVLGRSIRNVLIIDSGMPCNKQTPYSHNFITQDGEKPAEITKKAKEQVLKYNTVTFHSDIATSGKKTEKGFVISTKLGEEFIGKKLIFSTGIKDIIPDIKGLTECWGISMIHCPYCHGFELKNKKTGIMANGDRALHLASLVNNLTDNLTILTSGEANFNENQLAKLHKHNIKIIESEITEIVHENGKIANVVFKNGNEEAFKGVYAALAFTQHSNIPELLGCELNEHGYIKVDDFQKTTVEGVYACGDNSTMMRSVANAVYSGNVVGAMINKELTDEQF